MKNKILMLNAMLSHFSRVQLCVTPQTGANQAPPSLGFSRQEHWSGLPFPSPMRESERVEVILETIKFIVSFANYFYLSTRNGLPWWHYWQRVCLRIQETQETGFLSLSLTQGFYPLDEEMATHSSILAWKIPWTEEPDKLQSMGLQRIRFNWAQIYKEFTRNRKGPSITTLYR